ncbi:hypothetical protein FQN51_003767 [Onygenales sp. PD_10]|nr:hypothetical protein FQN51_003767 [Onygenales sp. PD_10]
MAAVQDPHVISLLSLPSRENAIPPEPLAIINAWASDFLRIQSNGHVVPSIFHQDAWLRDMVVLSWDFRSIHGADNIGAYFVANIERANFQKIEPRSSGPFQPTFKTAVPGLEWIETMFDFETETGRGSGVLRLVLDVDDKWKAYLLSFTLQELKGFEEPIASRRSLGGNNSLAGDPQREDWLQKREREQSFKGQEPKVLIIGAGHSGLMVGARLRQLGVPSLIVERNERVGDNWRKRYRTLATHDPVHYCQMPYMPFPSNWPLFTPKDKLAGWLEMYASAMELNVWTSTNVERAEFHEDTNSWTVTLRTADGSRVVHPKHVILATGQSDRPIIPNIPGQDQFQGAAYHTSQHKDATSHGDLKGKNVVVIGTGNSGHDIAQNFYENGAGVTMLQRGGTFVISQRKGVMALMAGLYDETGPSSDDADMFVQSTPLPVTFAFQVYATKMIAETLEKDELEGLKRVGFVLDAGSDGAGLFRKYLARGGGYYLDVGCSQLIRDGKVKVRQSKGGVERFEPDGLVLADGNGTKLQADIVVFATGYENMRNSARRIVGDKIADKLSDVWGLDEEGELKGMCRYSGHPNFWYMGGNLALCRMYSRLLALQIKGVEEGLYVSPALGGKN